MNPQALIDLSALKHNFQRARQAAPHSRVVAVIKANAYGHGLIRVAHALHAADLLAVARVSEGLRLRAAGIDKPILILEGCFDKEELQVASVQQLQLVIHSREQLLLLEMAEVSTPTVCWLKVDTGMHRLGIHPEDAVEVHRHLCQLKSVSSPVRLMTHLANADDLQDTASRLQLECFRPLVDAIGVETSIANSAGILGWPEARSEWIRPGIMLYGASPFQRGRAENDGLQPVMTLSSRLIAVNRQPRGAGIGYGGSWRCPEKMPVGVAAIGYGDGYPRHAPAGTPVLLNGRRVPLIGRVSMDMITLDLRTQSQARIGDPVTLWGRGLPAEEVAEAAGTIAYELFCSVTSRVEFVEV